MKFNQKNYHPIIRKYFADHEMQKRYLAVFLVLSMLVSLTVSMGLMQPAISMTNGDEPGNSAIAEPLANSVVIDRPDWKIKNYNDGKGANEADGEVYSPGEEDLITLIFGTGEGLEWADQAENLDQAMAAAQDKYFLGMASDFCAFIEGDFTATEADAEGRVAVGGNLTFTKDWNYQIGSGDYGSFTPLLETDNYWGKSGFATALIGGKMLRVNTLSTGRGKNRHHQKDGGYFDGANGYHIVNTGDPDRYTVYYKPEEGLYKKFIIGDALNSEHYDEELKEDRPYSSECRHDYPCDLGTSCHTLHSYLASVNEFAQMYKSDDINIRDVIAKAFAMVRTRSANLAQQQGIVVTDGKEYGEIIFQGPGKDKTDIKTVYFTVDNWLDYRSIKFNGIPENANIIVNCGQSDDVKIDGNVSTEINGDIISKKGEDLTTNNNFASQRILYNFYNTSNLTINGNFNGTILAPNADVLSREDQSPGHLSGALIAKSFRGGLEFGYRPYRGDSEILSLTSGYAVPVDKFISGSDEKLSGAEFVVKNESGEKIFSWISGEETHYAPLPSLIDFTGNTNYGITGLELTLNSDNVKKDYTLNEELNYEKLTATLTCADPNDSNKEITLFENINVAKYPGAFNFEGFDSTTAGSKTIKVTCSDKLKEACGISEDISASFGVTVNPEIKYELALMDENNDEIALKEYNLNDAFNLEELKPSIKCISNDGNSEEISYVSIKGLNVTAVEKTLLNDTGAFIFNEAIDVPTEITIKAEFTTNDYAGYGFETDVTAEFTLNVTVVDNTGESSEPDESGGSETDVSVASFGGLVAFAAEEESTEIGSEPFDSNDDTAENEIQLPKIQTPYQTYVHTYTISEEKAPEGFFKTDVTYNVTVTEEVDLTKIYRYDNKSFPEEFRVTITIEASDSSTIFETINFLVKDTYNGSSISRLIEIGEDCFEIVANDNEVTKISKKGANGEFEIIDEKKDDHIVTAQEIDDIYYYFDPTVMMIMPLPKAENSDATTNLEFYNTPGLLFKKKDDAGHDLTGATIQLYKGDVPITDTNIWTWENSSKLIDVTQLELGAIYKFVETAPPANHLSAKNICFKKTDDTYIEYWEEDGEPKTLDLNVNREIVMTDERILGMKLKLFKYDADDTDKKLLEGAEFSLFANDGTLVCEKIIPSSNDEIFFEKDNLPHAYAENGYLKPGVYYLVETQVPEHPDFDENGETFEKPDRIYFRVKKSETEGFTVELIENEKQENPQVFELKWNNQADPNRLRFLDADGIMLDDELKENGGCIRNVESFSITVSDTSFDQFWATDEISKSVALNEKEKIVSYRYKTPVDLDNLKFQSWSNPLPNIIKAEVVLANGSKYVYPYTPPVTTATTTSVSTATTTTTIPILNIVNDENNNSAVLEVANKPDDGITDISVEKIWANDGGFEDLRPEEIIVQLYRTKEKIENPEELDREALLSALSTNEYHLQDTVTTTTSTSADSTSADESTTTSPTSTLPAGQASLNKDNDWKYTFKGLPSRYKDSTNKWQPYYYYIIEQKADAKDPSIIYVDSYTINAEGALIVTNELQTVEIKAKKTWAENKDITKPKSVVVKLQRAVYKEVLDENGSPVLDNDGNIVQEEVWEDVPNRTLTLKELNNYEGVFTGLPAGWKYRMVEPNSPSGWKPEGPSDVFDTTDENAKYENPLVVNNIPDLGKLTVVKNWIDKDENSTGMRPNDKGVQFALYRKVRKLWPENQEPQSVQEDYARLLQYSLYFYDGVMCGDDVGEKSAYYWRDNCHSDPELGYADATVGGYHDAGDHVMFGLPSGFSASNIGWHLYEYRDECDKLGQTPHMKVIMDHYAEYFERSVHYADDGSISELLAQKGHGNTDHKYWGIPEGQTSDKYYDDEHVECWVSDTGSDIAAEYAAALALSYINFHQEAVDNNDTAEKEKYERYLELAKKLYDFSISKNSAFNQLYWNQDELDKNEYPGYYVSNGYTDDQAWAAAWLAVASEKAGNNNDYTTYKTACQNLINGDMYDWNGHHWNSVKYGAIAVNAAHLNGSWDSIKTFVEGTLNNGNVYLSTNPWGNSRYNAGYQAIVLMAAKYQKLHDEDSNNYPDVGIDCERATDWCQKQMNYILGDNAAGGTGVCFVTNFAENSVKKPHYRAGSGQVFDMKVKDDPEIIDGGYDFDRNRLIGGLVGGTLPYDIGDKPDEKANESLYKDIRSDFKLNEVASDYNANLIGAAAGLYHFFGTGHTYEIPGVKIQYLQKESEETNSGNSTPPADTETAQNQSTSSVEVPAVNLKNNAETDVSYLLNSMNKVYSRVLAASDEIVSNFNEALLQKNNISVLAREDGANDNSFYFSDPDGLPTGEVINIPTQYLNKDIIKIEIEWKDFNNGLKISLNGDNNAILNGSFSENPMVFTPGDNGKYNVLWGTPPDKDKISSIYFALWGTGKITKVTFYYTPEATLTADKTEIVVGDTATITPEFMGNISSWTSSNENIATVENGVVTGVGIGKTTITATDESNNTASIEITVTNLKLNNETFTITEDESVILTANANVNWSVSEYPNGGAVEDIKFNPDSNSDSCTIKPTIGKWGTYKIKAQFGDVENEYNIAYATIIVNPVKPEIITGGIVGDNNTITLVEGDSITAELNCFENTGISIDSNDVADLIQGVNNIILTAKTEGTATLTLTRGDETNKTEYTINVVPFAITPDSSNAGLVENDETKSVTFTANSEVKQWNILDKDGINVTESFIIITNDNTTFKFSAKNGVDIYGEFKVKAESVNGKEATSDVTVQGAELKPVGMIINESNPVKIVQGGTVTVPFNLIGIALNDGGTGDSSIANASISGNELTIIAGNTTGSRSFTVTRNGRDFTVYVEVEFFQITYNQNPATDENPAKFEEENTITLNANASATWKCDDELISLTQNGDTCNVKANLGAHGKYTITATYGTSEATAIIEVTPHTLSITNGSNSIELLPGDTKDITFNYGGITCDSSEDATVSMKDEKTFTITAGKENSKITFNRNGSTVDVNVIILPLTISDANTEEEISEISMQEKSECETKLIVNGGVKEWICKKEGVESSDITITAENGIYTVYANENALGEYTITAKYDKDGYEDITASAKVTVTAGELKVNNAESITINVLPGQSDTTATLNFSSYYEPISYSESNIADVEIGNNGSLTIIGKSEGQTVATITRRGKSVTIIINVASFKISHEDGSDIDKDNPLSVAENGTLTLTANAKSTWEILNKKGEAAPYKGITLTPSDDGKTCTINVNDDADIGDYQIRATDENNSENLDTVDITVTAQPLKIMYNDEELNVKKTVELKKGEKIALTPTPNNNITYAFEDNNGIVLITTNNTLTAVKPGLVTIKATRKGKEVTFKVRVRLEDPSDKNITLRVGQSLDLAEIFGKDFNYSLDSTNPDVERQDNKVTVISYTPDPIVIIAELRNDPEQTININLNVIEKLEIWSSEKEPDTEPDEESKLAKYTMKTGETLKFKVRNNIGEIKWSSDNAIASIDEVSGKVTVYGFGNAKITATDSGDKAVAKIVLTIEKTPVVVDTEGFEFCREITVNSGDNWETEVGELEYTDKNGDFYYYYIVELDDNGRPIGTEGSMDYITGVGAKYIPVFYQNGLELRTEGNGGSSLEATNQFSEEMEGQMPSTGGEGVKWYYITGSAIIILTAAAYVLARRKLEIVED